MTETVFFCPEIVDVVFAGFGNERDLLNNFYAVNFEAANFLRVVGQDSDIPETQVATDLRADSIVSFVS